MIERIQAYKASDGTIFGELGLLQEHELSMLLTPANGIITDLEKTAAQCLVAHRDKVLNILRLRRPAGEERPKTSTKKKSTKAPSELTASASN